jgi:hypothetical protein
MSDSKASIESIHTLLKEVLVLLTTHHDESKAVGEQTLMRLETQLLNRAAPKRAVRKKGTKDKKSKESKEVTSKTYSNTMYWYAAMYANTNDNISGTYTPAEEKKATESCKTVKNKSEYDKQRHVGFALWKAFSQDKRQNALKSKFDSWKKALEKKQAKDVEAETHSGDEEEPAK